MKLKKMFALVLTMSILLSTIGINTSVYAKKGSQGKSRYKIYLKSGTLEPKDNLEVSVDKAARNEEQAYIVAFTGPIYEEMKKSAEKAGAKLLEYLPDFSYISFISPNAVSKVKNLECVADVLPYQAQYKMDSSLLSRISNGNEKDLDKDIEVNISTFDGDISQLENETAKNNNSIINKSKGNVRLKTKLKHISDFSKMKNVKYIEEASKFELDNDVARGIIGSESVSSLVYEGSDQIVSVADTGLDTGNPGLSSNTLHPDFADRVNLITTNTYSSTNGIDYNGHGTHVSGSVLGSGQASDGKIKGVAPKAHLIMQQVANSSGQIIINDSVYNLFRDAYNSGARIHTNSWSSDGFGAYTSECNKIDTYAWDYKDATVLFSAGNRGRSGACTVGSPSAAKNCITVGATVNYRPYLSLSQNPDDIAVFSAYGCQDGRIKPDVVAPGESIASTVSSNAFNGSPYPGNSYYGYKSGTSMSTPITAGAIAVIREYIQKNRAISSPSAALIKAFTINGALTYGNSQRKGWGKVSLYDSMLSTNIISYTDSLQTGQTLTYASNCNVTGTDKPLKISLVWTDFPGSETASKALVNDLDLKVTSPDGTIVYNGNDFTSPYNSAVDRVNNVEAVTINTPQIGTYKVEVTGYDVPDGPQPFALVYSADFFSVPKNVRAVPSKNSITLNWDAVPGASGYDVEVDGTTVVNASETSYMHSNLVQNTLHTYRVRAKNATNTGDWSNTVNIYTALDAPTVSLEPYNSGITSTWTPVTEATDYDVYVNNNKIYADDTSNGNFTLPCYEKNSTFNFMLRSRTAFNYGDSVPVSAATLDYGLSYKKTMNEARSDFSAVASTNGKIYAIGGKKGIFYLNSVEEYNPSTDTWTAKAPMGVSRIGLGAVEAANGKIYAIGGFTGSAYSNSVEEYDPVLNQWTVKQNMPTARAWFGIAYTNGKIYVIGGTNGSALSTVEIYDPATNQWTTGTSMPTARSKFGMSKAGEKIIAAGGINGTDTLKAVEEYDAALDVWTIKKNMPDCNADFSMSEQNGRLYTFGGTNSGFVQEFNPQMNLWAIKSKLPANIYGNASAAQSGKLYILGGFDGSSQISKVMEYNTKQDDWVKASSTTPPMAQTCSVAYNGKIYTFGGFGGNQFSLSALNSVEEFDASTNTWTTIAKMSKPTVGAQAVAANGKIYVMGGADKGSTQVYCEDYYDTLEEFDPVTKEMTLKAPMPEKRYGHRVASVNGYIYVIGGYEPSDYNIEEGTLADTVLRYDPNNNVWTTLANPIPVPRAGYMLGVVNGKIYVIGGNILDSNNDEQSINSILEFDPTSNIWTAKQPAPSPMSGCSITLNDRIYFIGTSGSEICEYNPTTEAWGSKGYFPVEGSRASLQYLDNKFYVFGGLNSYPLVSMNTHACDEYMSTLTVGSSFMDPKAEKKFIPVTLSNVPEEGIYQANAVIHFDPSKISVTNTSAGEIIPNGSGFTCTVNNTLGTVAINFTGDTQTLIENDGVLANIEFDVKDTVNTTGSTALTLDSSNCNLYKNSSYQYSGIKLINGEIDIFMYGDVNGSSSITSDDSSMVYNYLLNRSDSFSDEYGRLAADVDGDGVVSALDLSLINMYIAGSITEFPVQQ